MNIAVVGSGRWGKNHVRNYNELNSLYAVCEASEQKRAELSAEYPNIKLFTDFNEMLNDKNINGIVIATPAPTHFELVKKSLEAGFPTFVEKPFTLDFETSKQLTELAESKNLPLMVGHILEYHPAVTKMRELVKSGEIGNVKHVRCTRINLGSIRNQENIWWSFAPHDLTIIFGLIDKEPVKINATSFKPINDGVEDTVYVDLGFEDGTSAHIHVSWLEPIKHHQTVVVGETGMIVFDDSKKEDKLKLFKYSYDEKAVMLNRGEEINVEFLEGQPLKLECEHFIGCIKTNKQPKTDGKSACRVMKALEQADKLLKG
jgi:UDP-2-acetamido-3-amino-2,3-dideoxy-glucuronate N-acetyltransferase